MKQKIFDKPCYPTVHFSESILTECPKCLKMGVVRTKLPKYTLPFPRGYHSTFSCNFCTYQLIEQDQKYDYGNDNKEWHGYMQGYIEQKCGHCGSDSIFYISKPTRKISESKILQCNVCKHQKEYQLKWRRYRNETPTDPYFGLKLFIQIEIKGHILWAYNFEHLDYIHEYVMSDLRNDNNRSKYSIISNLPKWVALKKNREVINRKIRQFSNTFGTGVK